MLEPPQRSSLWRVRPWKKDKTIPKNLEDYGLNCGGFWRLHGINKGQCGVCGDPYDAVSRQNEPGGKYANGIIVRRYRQHRKFINVTLDITSNIGGHFEFRLCPHNNVTKVVTQECLDRNRLTIEGHGLKFIPTDERKYKLALLMPDDVTCKQCVLQWKWRGAYNWGRCDDGYQDVGCGNQEEYYNCADIAILPSKRGKPSKTPKPVKTIDEPTEHWNTIINKDIVRDKIKTTQPSKDVKTITMSKDVNDIKTIDNILDQSNIVPSNNTEDVASGIPVYLHKPEVSTILPPIDVTMIPTMVPTLQDTIHTDLGKPEPALPPIFVGNLNDITKGVISEPLLPEIKSNIFDITSPNGISGVNQDLVQSPGNNIFNRAQWIAGTLSPPASGLELLNASGGGKATLLHSANTNQSMFTMHNKTVLNATENALGIPVTMEDTTLDPLSINRNMNMLRDMFYGAMAAGGDVDLDTLLPLQFFPFDVFARNTQSFGDLTDQFLQSVYALNRQKQANASNEMKNNELNMEQTNVNSDTSKVRIENSPVTPKSSSTMVKVSDTLTGMVKPNNSVSPLKDITMRKEITTVNIPVLNRQLIDPPMTKSRSINGMSSTTTSPVINQQLINPPMTKNRSINGISLSTTSPVINQQLINRPTTEGQIIDFMPQTTTNAWHEVLSRMNTLLNNLNSQLDTMVYDPNGQGGTRNINHLTNDVHLKTPVGLTGEINNQSNRGTGIPIALPLVSGNGPGLVAQNAFHKDGMVVSDVGSLLMQNPGVLYVERPSIDIASSWDKLSQVPLGFLDNTINQNINAQENNFTGSRLQGNKPIVISDPKTKFSFKKLDARNVDVLGIAVDAPTVANENSIISQPKISVLNSPEIFRKQNFVFSEPRNQPLSDVTLPKLNKRNAEESFHNSNNVPVNIKIVGNTGSQDKIVNARILDRLLKGLNSGISISNTAQNRLEVNENAPDITTSVKAENNINSIGTGTNPLKLMSKKRQSNSVNVWTQFKSLIPTEISNSINSLFNRTQNNGKSKQFNVWNQFKQEKQQIAPTVQTTNSMDTAFNSIMNNGLWVYPKSTPIKRTTQGPILGGATNSMLDLMAGLWNSQTTAYPLYQGNTIV
ncbi:uncharacterized protein LOC127721133 [Mytilus californianus]|uniref:uncharacterized protein LOC127721133 n=1 Tax=Mytilus californianus TaxID=6549 RepID=UPI0022461FF9|nr:uncharacterized protein LOC127721133 [Mytilus californianus]